MNQGLVAFIVGVVFTVLSGIFVVLRCISRFIIVKQGGIDDALVILAWLAMIGTTTTTFFQYRHGLGLAIYEINPRDYSPLLKSLWLNIIFYGLGAVLLKISALTQYLRFLFEGWLRICCYMTIISLVGGGIVTVVLPFTQCQPFSYFWDIFMIGGKCLDITAWYYAASTFMIITDIIVVGIPMLAIKNLTMQPRQKKALIVVFALGGFGCIASILRFWCVTNVVRSKSLSDYNTAAAYWSSIEVNTGIVCICIPPLKVLYSKLEARFLRTRRSDTSGNERLASAETISEMQQSSVQSSFNFPVKKRSLDPWVVPA